MPLSLWIQLTRRAFIGTVSACTVVALALSGSILSAQTPAGAAPSRTLTIAELDPGFTETLTDEELLHDPRFADQWPSHRGDRLPPQSDR